MIHLNIKPLSVNLAWQGRRYKTKKYLQYEKNLLFLLPKLKLPEVPYHLFIEYGFSNKSCDIDNPQKLLGDILQKKYGFNDRDIYALDIRKMIVPKGKEYIKIKIEHYGT